MVWVIFKLILFLVLTAIPFAYHYAVKNKGCENFYTFVFRHARKCFKSMTNMRIGMRRFKSFRKLFCLLLALLLSVVQFVDLRASEYAQKNAIKNYIEVQKFANSKRTESDKADMVAAYHNLKVYSSYETHPFSYVIGLALIAALLIYRWGNSLLCSLHNSLIFWMAASVTIAVVVVLGKGRWIMIAECLYIILAASFFYLEDLHTEDEQGH